MAEARGRSDVSLMLLDPHLRDVRMFDFASSERYYVAAREAFLDRLQNARLALTFARG